MNPNKRISIPLIYFLVTLLITQCSLPERTDRFGAPDRPLWYKAWLFTPHEGAIVGVGDVVPVNGVVNDSRSLTGLEHHLIFLANGLMIGQASDTGGSYGQTIQWIPEQPGEYYLQVYSSLRGKWAISEPVKVCVIDFSLATPELGEIGFYEGTRDYMGDCEIPERSTEAIPGRLTLSTITIPGVLNNWDYSAGLVPVGCNLDSTIVFVSTVEDSNDDVTFVKVDVSYEIYDGIDSTTLLLGRLGGSALIPKIFGGEYLPSS